MFSISHWIIWILQFNSVATQLKRDFSRRYFDGKFDVVSMNKRLVANVLTKTTVSSAVSCVNSCMVNGKCKSINVNTETKECELLDATTSEDDQLTHQHAPGWTHYDYAAPSSNPNEICIAYGSNNVCCPEGFTGQHCDKKARILSIPSATVDLPSLTKSIPRTDQISICGWLNAVANSPTGGIIGFYPGENYIMARLESNSHLRFYLKSDKFIVTETPLLRNKWTHICITWHVENAVGHVLTYQDGTVVTHKTSANTEYITANDYFINLGNDMDNGIINDASQAFLGKLFDWNFYTKRLSYDQIISLYHGEQISNANLAVSWEEFQVP